MTKTLLVLGGARSGKSAYAEDRAQMHAGEKIYIATAEMIDAEMAERVRQHQGRRGQDWRTVEAPLALPKALRQHDAPGKVVLIDCVTVWIGNRVLRGDTDEAILAGADELAALVPRCGFDVTLVSNEVGEGVHPETAIGVRFRDLLGITNQRLAAACEHVVLMVAGLPLTIKAPEVGSHVRAPEAP